MKKEEFQNKPSRRPAEIDFRKTCWKAGTMLAPVPVVMVSCGGAPGTVPNIITVAWTGTVCTNPAMLSISVRPERHSYSIIKKEGEFVVNLPGTGQAAATDWCGVKSGREVNKFEALGLTPVKGLKVSAPSILECPVSIECIVRNRIALGSHVMFLGEIVTVQVRESLIDKKGKLHLEKAGLLSYAHGEYFQLGAAKGKFGFSVRRK